MVLSYPLPLSRHASSQTPTNPKARAWLPSQYHPSYHTTNHPNPPSPPHASIPTPYDPSHAAHHEPTISMAVLQPPGLSTISYFWVINWDFKYIYINSASGEIALGILRGAEFSVLRIRSYYKKPGLKKWWRVCIYLCGDCRSESTVVQWRKMARTTLASRSLTSFAQALKGSL